MKARIKFLYHSIKWYSYTTFRFMGAGPILLIGWGWEYCRLVKNVMRGFSSVLDVPEVSMLLVKGLFATAISSYRHLKKHWQMRSAFIEQEVDRLASLDVSFHFKTWYMESRLQMRRYEWSKRYGNLQIVQRGLLDYFHDRISPPIEGDYKYVG